MFTMKLSTVRVLSRRGSLAMMKYLNGQHFICSLPYFFLGYLSCCELNLLNADSDLPATYKNGRNKKKMPVCIKAFLG